jgi:anti-sigma factor RsiW
MTRSPARRAGPPASTRTICCVAGDRIWAYLDGELPAAGARTVARHVGSCAVCGLRARRLRAMLESCRSAGCRKLPPEVRDRARMRVRALLGAAQKKK